MSAFRKYGTCFFEEYARIELSALLGREFDDLVVRDRPDLQSRDGARLGIEVTRAMEESKHVAQQLLKEVAGIVPAGESADLESISESGYAYGLREGQYVGARELSYWQLAQPLRSILKSKVSKLGHGLYGHFGKKGLFVFSKDNMNEGQMARTCRYMMQLQAEQEIRYNRLYLADINELFVCNLDDGLSFDARLVIIPVSREQRRDFYLRAVDAQISQG
ncbi:MAG: hypothetical protein Q4E27_01695 [Bacteroidales bacterium]|nr:hypothetical protein [Bacteroidales bacterium]